MMQSLPASQRAIQAGSRMASAHQPAPSQTMTTTSANEETSTPFIDMSAGVLRLRGEPRPEADVERSSSSSATSPARRARPAAERHVQWTADTVNNEGMGKKSSKVCCIYHKPRAVGESSDEDSSDSDSSSSDSNSDSADDGAARPSARGGRRNDCAGHSHGRRKKYSPNAYEKQPRSVRDKEANPRV